MGDACLTVFLIHLPKFFLCHLGHKNKIYELADDANESFAKVFSCCSCVYLRRKQISVAKKVNGENVDGSAHDQRVNVAFSVTSTNENTSTKKKLSLTSVIFLHILLYLLL